MVKIDHTFENNPIKIGETSGENDEIIRESNQSDVWFHMHNLPSCHVIIKNTKEHPITKQMINYCANLVKENTKYRNLPKVKINYTQIKNVKKTDVKGRVHIKGKIQNIVI